MYADSIEGWLRDWRNEYTRLAEKNRTLELLNHLARDAKPEAARS